MPCHHGAAGDERDRLRREAGGSIRPELWVADSELNIRNLLMLGPGEREKGYPQRKSNKSKTRKSRRTNDDQLLNNRDPRPDGHFAKGQDMELNPRFDQF